MSNNTARKPSPGQMKTSRQGTRILALEPRYVFDAAIGAELHHQIDVHAATSSTGAHSFSVSGDDVAAAARVLMQPDSAAAVDAYRVPDSLSVDRTLAAVIADHNQAGTQKEIAFIDSRLADLSTLINDIPDNVRIVLIDPSRDGIAQMVEALNGESGVTAIHILSHGSDGHIDLGTSVVDEQSISTIYKSALTSIAANLSADADILVYGCDFGAGEIGGRAAAALAGLTGADVASSTNLTGGGAGADWVLEKSTGTIDEKTIVAADWNHDLLDISASNGANTGIKNTDVTGDLSSQVTALNPVAPVTFTAGTFATTQGGSVTITSDGKYTYTPKAGFIGDDTFGFEGAATDPTDGVTQYATAVETITIGPDPGYVIHAVDETNAVGYEKFYNGTVVDNVTKSTKGGPITTYTKTGTGPSHGALVFNPDGTFKYTPNAGYSGQDSFTFSADDADPNSDAASATVNFNVDPKPLVTNNYDSYAVKDAPITVKPYVTEATPGATLTYAAGTSPNGTLTSNGDGTFTFLPTAGFAGDTSATYTVTDSNGYVSTSTIYFHYTASGIAPINAAPDTYTIRQGDTASQGLSYWETNTNAIPATYTISFDTAPKHGTLTVTNAATGAYTYIADPGYLGPDSFKFTVTDQYGQSASSTENINIVPPDMSVDFSVKFAKAGVSVAENLGGETHESAGNTTEVFAIGGTTLVTGGTIKTAHGTVTVTNAATGAYTWQPDAGFSGVETINWSVKNVWGAGPNDFYETKSSTDTIISPDKIFAGHRGYAIPENTTKTGTVTAFSGAPTGTPTYTPTFAAAHGSATVDGAGNYSYTPNFGYHGLDKFGYKISNGLGNTATGYVTIYTAGPLVAGDNAPVALAIPDKVNLDKDTPVNISVASSFTDADNDTMTFIADGLPPGLSMNSAGKITGTIDRSASQGGDFGDGRYTVTVFADDGKGGVAQQTFSWEVTNPPPVAVTEGTSTPYNTPVTVDLLHNDSDPDGDPLTVTDATVPSAQGTVAFDGNKWVFTPAASFKGTATITYIISDGEGGTATSTHTVVVAAPPIAAVNDSYTTPYDTDLAGDAAKGDTYAPNSVFTATSTPLHGSVTMNPDGTYTYNPDPTFSGVDSFTYQVKDPTGQFVTATETITIKPAMSAVDDHYTTPFNTSLAGNAAAGDTYYSGSTFTATSTPLHGVVAMNADGTYTYTPAKNYYGTDTFTYQVKDLAGLTVSATETITILPPPIVAVNDSYKTPYNTPLSASAAKGDSYLPGSTFAAVTQPGHGTLTMKPDGTYVFKPAPGFSGKVTFTYKITDVTGQTATATETIVVAPPALAAHDHVYQAPYEKPMPGNAAAGNTFPTGSKFSVVSQPGKGTVTMNPNGTYTYVPPKGFTGTTTFKYQIKDPTGQIVTATEKITISSHSVIVHCLTTFGNFTGLLKPRVP
jgi:large repetitive protein